MQDLMINNQLADVFFKIDCHAESIHNEWDFHVAKNMSTSKAHRFEEPLIVCSKILQNEIENSIPGVICEFGCYTGISSAKLSLISSHLKKQMFVFDSFQGLPEIDVNASDTHKSMYQKGQYCCSIETVKKNISLYGSIDNVTLVKGFFSDTLSNFNAIDQISYCFIDVDLCKSLEECLDFVLPRLQKNGILFSHEAKDPDYIPVFEKYGLMNNENYISYGVGNGIFNTNICFFVKKTDA